MKTKPKFTEGPWKIETEMQTLSNVQRGTTLEIEVHYVNSESMPLFKPIHASKQDAHLIAAAPDMYELIRLVYAATDGGHDGNISLGTRRMLAEKSALLLAKARGET